MKFYSLLVCFLLSQIAFSQHSAKPETIVTAATVFTSGAMLTRDGVVSVKKGENIITISNLPVDLHEESVRLSFADTSNIIILDIRVEDRVKREYAVDQIKALQKKVDSLKTLQRIQTDKEILLQNQKEFLNTLKPDMSKLLPGRAMPDAAGAKQWDEMILFVDGKLEKLFKAWRILNECNDSIRKEIDTLQGKIEKFAMVEKKSFKELIAKIYAEKAMATTVSVSYLVDAVSWYPRYDEKITYTDSLIEQSYFAVVKQNTGEDWKKVSLSLSTIVPGNVKDAPELTPWYIDTRPVAAAPAVYTDNGFVRPDVRYITNSGLPRNTAIVSGYVYDAGTGEPMAAVFVGGLGGGKHTYTDSSGKFYIPGIGAGAISLKIEFPGYQSMTIQMDAKERKTAECNFYLTKMSLSTEDIAGTRSGLQNTQSVNNSAPGRFETRYVFDAAVQSNNCRIKGGVFDSETGEPLPGASVVLTGTTKGAVTNSDGDFFILNVQAGVYRLKATFIGFGEVTADVNALAQNITICNLFLPALSLNTNNILGTVDRNVANMSAIVQNSFGTLPIRDGQGVVSTQSGVVRQSGNLYVRGSRADATGMYVDGVRVNDPDFEGEDDVLKLGKGTSESAYERVDVTVDAKELSTSFTIKEKVSLSGDNKEQTVSIAVSEFPIATKFTAIPGSAPGVFMTAKFANTNSFPWLQGPVRVTLDKEFVGTFAGRTTVPGDTLYLGVGKIDGLIAEKKLVKRLTEGAGLLSSDIREIFEYEIILMNKLNKPVTVDVYDQVPVPASGKIKVELLEPAKEKYNPLKDNRLEWKCLLAPGEKKMLKIAFTVTHPQGIPVGGL
ncbi:MAG: mucoidy inhibitor MuiA family protein [Ignavibacteriales bacterium]|nr:mucoidy inhibitor MuiA family protein [Ignavibacteriales bacterium]